MNRKAQENILSIWNVLAWIIAAAGIVLAVSAYYSAYLDVRGLESEILSNRISDCILSNGFLKSDVFSEDYDLLDDCKFNAEIIEDSFYIGVSVFDFDSCKYIDSEKELKCIDPIVLLEYGNPNFQTQCDIRQDAIAEKFSLCDRQTIYSLSGRKAELGRELIIKIMTGSNQEGGG
jgi:hypothetical protein